MKKTSWLRELKEVFFYALGSIVIAVFAAVLQKLLKNAIDIKSENDLTV